MNKNGKIVMRAKSFLEENNPLVDMIPPDLKCILKCLWSPLQHYIDDQAIHTTFYGNNYYSIIVTTL